VAAPFNFMSFFLPWEAHHYQRLLDKFEAGLQPGYTPVYVLGNHDRQRLASRIGLPAARSAAMLQLTMPGVAVIYYGEELGMQNAVITGKDVLDGYEKNIPGLGFDRDVARTPMQWDGSQNAGFTTGRAWLPVAAGYEHTNVADESGDPTSLLNLYKKLLKLRQSMPALLHGTYEPLTHTQAHLFGFVRAYQGQRLAVIINFSSTTTIHLTLAGTQLLSTCGDSVGADILLPSEGKIIELSPKRGL
jgi:alpha-glucosidase